MKTAIKLAATGCLLATLHPQLGTCFAQGSLTPPGAPAPTMKTLTQIEPRSAITNTGAVTISRPGSYYLTTNVTVASGNAITIATNEVTLDLNGFRISSTANPAAGVGILLGGAVTNITIHNGHIRGGVTNYQGVYSGPGFLSGIQFGNAVPVNARVTGVSVSGCQMHGIYLSRDVATQVESCTVQTVGDLGLCAWTVRGSVALDCGGNGILGQNVSDSSGESSVYGLGVEALTAVNCYGTSAGSYGVAATVAQNCRGVVYGSGGAGVSADMAQNCYGKSYGDGYGLYAGTAQNCRGSSASGCGLSAAYSALACFGSSGAGIGLSARTAAFCVGSSDAGTAIEATIANGCYAVAGTNNITYKYNMP